MTILQFIPKAATPVEPLDSVKYIVEHYKENADGTYSIAEEDTEILSGKIGATVIATAKTYKGYCFNEAQSEATASGVLKAISSADDILTLKLYYDIDNAGGGENGDEGDGTPDKYQKKVIFKVVNGKWADGTFADKIVYLDLMKDGEYAVDGTASLTAPADMVANEGYTVNVYGYTVNYLEKGTNKVLATAKTGSANFGTEVIEKAIDIKGYTLDGDNSRSIVIDTENNVINFYYTVNSYNYKVNYLEKDTNKVIATPRTRASKFGETVNETARVFMTCRKALMNM